MGLLRLLLKSWRIGDGGNRSTGIDLSESSGYGSFSRSDDGDWRLAQADENRARREDDRREREAKREADRIYWADTDTDGSPGAGVPDGYDEDVKQPADDYKHLKYPKKPLRKHDYVTWKPRSKTDIRLPVPFGLKGLVRSETIENTGAYCIVKWNRGGEEVLCNQMDLHLLGHVYNSLK